MTVRAAHKVSLYFQFDTAGGASSSFRVGTQTTSYTLNEATDFCRCWDNFVILQLPAAEVVDTLTGTIKSNNGMGYLRVNQGGGDEFCYTIEHATYFTNSSVRTVLLRVSASSSFDPRFYPRV